MEGYIKIHRRLFNHWVWKKKPFSKGQAWIDMLLLANHTGLKIPYKNQITTIERGEFIRSERDLSARWGWSKSKTHAFLKLLKSDSMITLKSDQKANRISICNYSEYQEGQTNKKPKKDQPPTSSRPKQECKECKEERNMCPYQDIVALYHKILPELSRVIKLTGKRKTQIKNIWVGSEKAQSLDWWEKYFQSVRQYPFLMGENDRGWKADIEFLTNKNKFVAILEGKYASR